MKTNFDAIVIGAGSIGLPIAYELSKNNLDILVIDKNVSIGQGSNKKAIGGIRATHSDSAKIALCQRSIEIFSSWKEMNGKSIDWEQKGYSFVAYDEYQEQKLKQLLDIQKSYGLNINWLQKKDLLKKIPNLNPQGLIGGTFSPEDGSASPLKTAFSYYELAKKNKVLFSFDQKVIDIQEKKQLYVVKTNDFTFQSKIIVNAAGAYANGINQLLEIDLSIQPDSHEAAITEPVEKIKLPMVVDMRSIANSSSVYFHQFPGGQFILCLTPEPIQYGYDERATSSFLPLLADRITQLIPAFENVRVRRTWRGLYPNTADGMPYIGESRPNVFQAIGMCGQGFMLGPSVGELVARAIVNKKTKQDIEILDHLSPFRNILKKEALK